MPIEQQPPQGAMESIPESTTVEPSASLDSGFSNDVVAIEPILSENITNSAPATLQYEDLAAIGSPEWTATGAISWTFELINVSTGLPWFWTIIAGTVFWELLLTPLSILTMKVSASLRPHQANIRALRAALGDAEKTNNNIEKEKVTIGLEEYYERHSINDLRFVAPFATATQLMVRSYLFIAVAKLCNIEQLAHSGFDLLPDLTIVDSTYVLPVLLAILVDSRLRVNTCQPNAMPR